MASVKNKSQFDRVADTKQRKLGTSAEKVTIISAAVNIEEIISPVPIVARRARLRMDGEK